MLLVIQDFVLDLSQKFFSGKQECNRGGWRVFVYELIQNGNLAKRRRMFELILHRLILCTTSMYETDLFFSEGKELIMKL
jgi:hypothetical protein